MSVNFTPMNNIVSPHKTGIPPMSDGGICPPPMGGVPPMSDGGICPPSIDNSDTPGICYFA